MSDTMRVERITLPAGEAGTDKTVSVMAKAAMSRFGAGSIRIRELALKIVNDADISEKDQIAEVKAVHVWTQNRLRYVRDPLWYELVTYPETLAFDVADGDCDDHSVLEAALLGALGIPTRFVVFAFNGSPTWQHVALQAMVRDTKTKQPIWISLDPIVKDKPAGFEVKHSAKRLYSLNSPTGATPIAGPVVSTVSAIVSVGALLFIFQRMLRKLSHGR